MGSVKVWPQSTGHQLQGVDASLSGRGTKVDLVSLKALGESSVSLGEHVADVGGLLLTEAGQLRSSIWPSVGVVHVGVFGV